MVETLNSKVTFSLEGGGTSVVGVTCSPDPISTRAKSVYDTGNVTIDIFCEWIG